jgi:Domain of unknown function (DUF4389)
VIRVSAPHVYPVRVGGSLEPRLSRWLWLVKWILAIPHVVVLAFLWIAFFVVSVIAWFAILIVGRYPRALFDFNVGVLRWTWRVAFYTYAALGTDRYPPFTLAEDRDYPAGLEVTYPAHLSRGLVLVKSWLLAVPHYLVVALFVGGGAWAARATGPWAFSAGTGLIGLLVFIAAIVLLFTGRYPKSIFDFVLGMNRWVLRVAAYASLMTDDYPPFRLDMGGDDPAAAPVEPSSAPPAPGATTPTSRWTAGRVLLLVLGSLVGLVGTAMLLGGGAAIAIDRTQRDAEGFLMSPTTTFSSPSYAIESETIDVSVDGPDWVANHLVGTVKIRSDATHPVFVGIASEADASSYLGGVERAVVTDLGPGPEYDDQSGGAPATPPAAQSIWAASTTGAGEQSLTWKPKSGHWVAVLMNADGSRGVESDMAIGAELDWLLWIAIGVAALGAVLLTLGVLGITFGVRRASSDPAA